MFILQMKCEFPQEAVVIDIDALMKVVRDILEALVVLISSPVWKRDDEAFLIGKLGPSVIVLHVIVAAAVPMEHENQCSRIRDLRRNVNSILSRQTIVGEVDLLRIDGHRHARTSEESGSQRD